MTDAEKYVRQKFPNANCDGQWFNGKRVRINGWWIIRSSNQPPYSSVPDSIGKGVTVIAAWADAANQLEKMRVGKDSTP